MERWTRLVTRVREAGDETHDMLAPSASPLEAPTS
jgi:hypothetical protein